MRVYNVSLLYFWRPLQTGFLLLFLSIVTIVCILIYSGKWFLPRVIYILSSQNLHDPLPYPGLSPLMLSEGELLSESVRGIPFPLHRRPASFFSRFSLARRFWNQTWKWLKRFRLNWTNIITCTTLYGDSMTISKPDLQSWWKLLRWNKTKMFFWNLSIQKTNGSIVVRGFQKYEGSRKDELVQKYIVRKLPAQLSYRVQSLEPVVRERGAPVSSLPERKFNKIT